MGLSPVDAVEGHLRSRAKVVLHDVGNVVDADLHLTVDLEDRQQTCARQAAQQLERDVQ